MVGKRLILRQKRLHNTGKITKNRLDLYKKFKKQNVKKDS